MGWDEENNLRRSIVNVEDVERGYGMGFQGVIIRRVIFLRLYYHRKIIRIEYPLIYISMLNFFKTSSWIIKHEVCKC